MEVEHLHINRKNFVDGKEFFLFACTTYGAVHFDSFCNSFVIEPDPLCPEIIILSIQSLKNRNSYEIVCNKKTNFFKAETLDLGKENFL